MVKKLKIKVELEAKNKTINDTLIKNSNLDTLLIIQDCLRDYDRADKIALLLGKDASDYVVKALVYEAKCLFDLCTSTINYLKALKLNRLRFLGWNF